VHNSVTTMTTESGRLLYWAATIVAAVIVVWDLADLLYGLSQGEPILRIAALVVAAFIWLIGRGCRAALAEY
jgi:hypothetical protein